MADRAFAMVEAYIISEGAEILTVTSPAGVTSGAVASGTFGDRQIRGVLRFFDVGMKFLK
jgi:hypothetical protein